MSTAQASSEPTLAFPPKGALRRVAFPKLVREIARGKVTGSLYLLNGQTKKVVFFEQGQPVFVRSNVLSECLGQVLSGEGLITQEQCEQTLEAIRRTGKKQGELLVEMGILSQGNLRYGLAAQLRAKLYDIFSWDDGRYQFKPEVPDNQFGVRLDARPEAVIIGAILDRYDEERAETLLSDAMEQYVTYGEDAPLDVSELELLPEERYFVDCIDGSRTVAECVRDDLAQSVPSPHALVYGLVQAGVVELTDTAHESRPRPARPSTSERPRDEALRPAFEPHNVITEYEDTPMPGELPKMQRLLGDHEDDFADVEALQTGTSLAPVAEDASAPGISEDLLAAEPDQVEETFDDAELGDASDASDEPGPDEGSETSDDADPSPPDEPPLMSTDSPEDDELVDPLAGLELDDLDAELDALEDPDPEPPPDVSATEPEPMPEEPEADVLDIEELEEIDVDGLGPEDDAPAEPPLVDLGADLAAELGGLQSEDPGATRADPLPPLAVDRDLGAAAPLNPKPEFEPELDLQPDAPLDDLEIDDDLLIAGGESPDLLPVADLDEVDIEALELDDDLSLDEDAPGLSADEGLVGLDELDDVDLSLDASDGPVSYTGPESTMQEDHDPEMVGAMRFNDAETALGEQRYPEAVGLLESAYDNGFDVAELHAMLAYARFMAAGQDLETAQHAFELLDYAESMDPSLDLVAAYRGSIHNALGDEEQARAALQRALELNPYCELAISLMDELG